MQTNKAILFILLVSLAGPYAFSQDLTGMWQHGQESDEDYELVEYTQEGFFHLYSHSLEHAYGTYTVKGAKITYILWPNAKGNITEPVEFTGTISQLTPAATFSLQMGNTQTRYRYLGEHSFTPADIANLQMMAQTFHRVNMEIIDGMDGTDDFYYKQVKDH